MINKSNFLITQLRAVTEFVVKHQIEVDPGQLLDELLGEYSRIEHAISWRKIHAGDPA